MVGNASQGSLAQRTGVALAEALRQDRTARRFAKDVRIRRLADLLLEGLEQDELPGGVDPTRTRSPDSTAALTVNTFLPWRRAVGHLPLSGVEGFDAIQFEVRCPTGLRGTPPHLDLLALRDRTVVAATVRCCEYLNRRKSRVAASYDRLLNETPGAAAWSAQLERLRAAPDSFRYVDVGALVKHALALGRTFPDRRPVLMYLFWEPVDADAFAEFRRHRAELAELAEALKDAGIAFAAQSFTALWQEWSERRSPSWLADHVARLRARYCVAIGGGEGL